MANWTNIATYDYTGYNGVGSHNEHATLQYDADRTTATYTYIRFVGSGGGYTNGYYVLFDATSEANSKLLTIKAYGGGWQASGEVKITKSYTASTFNIPAFWICCTGAVTPSSAHPYNITYADYSGSMYNCFHNKRTSWRTTFAATTKTGTTAEAVTAKKPTIIDNGNNTFTISCGAGTPGTNNDVISTTLYYRIGDSGSFTAATGLSKSGNLTCGASSKSQKVYAYSKVVGQYNTDESDKNHYATVKNYQPPKQPGKPELHNSSKKNGRLTVKQNWKFFWSEAGKTNDSSPVKGYWIRIWRWSKTNNSWSIPYTTQWEGTATSYTFNPITYGFVAGDLVQFEVAAYSKNGAGAKQWSPITSKWEGYDIYTISDSYLVENAGVVNVKVDSQWVEGQVYVKTTDGWVEAETVNVKTSDGWQESQ